MPSEAVALSVDAIDEDLAALAAWREREEQLLAGAGGFRDRGEAGSAGVGRRLLRRCAADGETRLLTLLHIEHALAPAHDHGVAIAFAGTLIESVVARLVAEPFKDRADVLVAALRFHGKDAAAAEALTRWGEGRQPTTLGTVLNVLLALRRAHEANVTEICQRVAQLFHRRYVALLCGKELARALNQVRDRYRNPAAHGLRGFDADEYERFARLAVARPRFRAWDAWGADPAEPPAHEAVFHHHLAGSRGADDEVPAAAPTALEQLLALQAPTAALRVELTVARDEGARAREVRPVAGAEEGTFHLGTALALTMRADADAYGLLLDVGTGGSVAVLWPSRWDADGRLPAGRPVRVPGPAWPAPVIVEGATGVERVVLLAALDPWPAEWRPGGSAAFGELGPDDLERLLCQVRARDPGRWAVARVDFRLVR
jgi:hypothetical protein